MNKRTTHILIALLIGSVGIANIQNSIAESNLQKTFDTIAIHVNLEDEDGIYLSPQPVIFSCQTQMANTKTAAMICIVTTDDHQPIDSIHRIMTPDTKGKVHQPIRLSLSEPGFYRIKVYAQQGRYKSRHKEFNIGYNPEQIISPTDPKPDFDEFWQKTLNELAEVKPNYQLQHLKDKSSATKDMYHVSMHSFGNVIIEGFYTVPKTEGKHPAIIRYMGYGSKTRYPDPNVLPDFCEFILSVRGQGIQNSKNSYGEWILHGLEKKETYYYRGAYMDLIRGIDFLTSRPEIDTKHIMAEGGSQGGAFTLVACALDKRIKAAAPRIPFLTDFRDYYKICPWPRSLFENYLKEHPNDNWDRIYHLLSYFDVKNLAGRIQCPIIMGIGLQDNVCPPHTNFASYNLLRSAKQYYVYPHQQHSVDASWWPVRETFFRNNIKSK